MLSPQVAQSAIVNGKTDAPPYTASKNPQYETIPLLTVGDEVPLLVGTWGNYSYDPNKKFAMVGIPDGLGVYETTDRYYVLINHEIAATDGNGNPVFTQISSNRADGKIKGTRVSLFEFDRDWNVLGGRNLIEEAFDAATGTTYNLNTATGLYENPSNPSDTINGTVGSFSRFCSGFLAQTGFYDDVTGQTVPFWFAPEENTSAPNNRGWAVSANGKAVSLDGIGRFSKEQVLATEQYRPLSLGNTSKKTVLLSSEDYKDGELYMWVGNQTAQDPNGFTDGQLYVLQVTDSNGNVYAYETMPEDVPLTAKWVPVPKDIAQGTGSETPDQITTALSDYANANGTDGQPRSTNFRRLEDIGEDPTQLGTFYIAVTGTTDIPPGATKADNPRGTLYRLRLNPKDPTQDGELTFVHDGGSGKGVSFDNLTVLTNGKVWVQEDAAYDPAVLGGDPLGDENRQAYIWEFDPNANGGTGSITPVAELLEEAYTNLGNDPNLYGEWESSGIVQVLNAPFPSTLFTVQAHTDKGQAAQFSEGGQLLLLRPFPDNARVPEPGTVVGLALFGLSALGIKRRQF